MGYLKKRRFGTLYKGLFPQPIQGAGLDLAWWCPSRWLLTQHWFRAWVVGASLHPSNQVIRYRKFFRRESHAMLLVSPNRFLVSVNQDSPSREGRESLYFRLGRSRHSRNSPVHRSITRVRIQSAHSERKKHSSWIDSLPQSKYLSIDPYSFGQSLHPLLRGAPCW